MITTWSWTSSGLALVRQPRPPVCRQDGGRSTSCRRRSTRMLVGDQSCGLPGRNASPATLNGANITLHLGRVYPQQLVRRGRPAGIDAAGLVDTRHGPPGPGNGRTYTSKLVPPASFDVVRDEPAVRRKHRPDLRRRRAEKHGGRAGRPAPGRVALHRQDHDIPPVAPRDSRRTRGTCRSDATTTETARPGCRSVVSPRPCRRRSPSTGCGGRRAWPGRT